jgi:hypothetical protein
MEQFKMRIGCEWRDASDGRTFESFNPGGFKPKCNTESRHHVWVRREVA